MRIFQWLKYNFEAKISALVEVTLNRASPNFQFQRLLQKMNIEIQKQQLVLIYFTPKFKEDLSIDTNS